VLGQKYFEIRFYTWVKMNAARIDVQSNRVVAIAASLYRPQKCIFDADNRRVCFACHSFAARGRWAVPPNPNRITFGRLAD
jgi:hypothetical protein